MAPRRPGDLILDRYKVVIKLSDTSIYSIYLADSDIGLLTIHELPHQSDVDPFRFVQNRAKFFKEISIAQALNGKPHIVNLFDAGSENDADYLVFEYMDGGSLQDRLLLKRTNPLSLYQIYEIAIDICKGLEIIHSHPMGIVHGDLTAANILLNKRGKTKITGFGNAYVEHPGSIETNGADGESSPADEASGTPLTPGDDIYSLGLIIFEMATGMTMAQAQRSKKANFAKINLPAILKAILVKALDPDPQVRFQKALELRGHLEQGLIEFIAAEESTPPEEVPAGTSQADNISQYASPVAEIAAVAETIQPSSTPVTEISDRTGQKEEAEVTPHQLEPTLQPSVNGGIEEGFVEPANLVEGPAGLVEHPAGIIEELPQTPSSEEMVEEEGVGNEAISDSSVFNSQEETGLGSSSYLGQTVDYQAEENVLTLDDFIPVSNDQQDQFYDYTQPELSLEEEEGSRDETDFAPIPEAFAASPEVLKEPADFQDHGIGEQASGFENSAPVAQDLYFEPVSIGEPLEEPFNTAITGTSEEAESEAYAQAELDEHQKLPTGAGLYSEEAQNEVEAQESLTAQSTDYPEFENEQEEAVNYELYKSSELDVQEPTGFDELAVEAPESFSGFENPPVEEPPSDYAAEVAAENPELYTEGDTRWFADSSLEVPLNPLPNEPEVQGAAEVETRLEDSSGIDSVETKDLFAEPAREVSSPAEPEFTKAPQEEFYSSSAEAALLENFRNDPETFALETDPTDPALVEPGTVNVGSLGSYENVLPVSEDVPENEGAIESINIVSSTSEAQQTDNAVSEANFSDFSEAQPAGNQEVFKLERAIAGQPSTILRQSDDLASAQDENLRKILSDKKLYDYPELDETEVPAERNSFLSGAGSRIGIALVALLLIAGIFYILFQPGKNSSVAVLPAAASITATVNGSAGAETSGQSAVVSVTADITPATLPGSAIIFGPASSPTTSGNQAPGAVVAQVTSPAASLTTGASPVPDATSTIASATATAVPSPTTAPTAVPPTAPAPATAVVGGANPGATATSTITPALVLFEEYFNKAQPRKDLIQFENKWNISNGVFKTEDGKPGSLLVGNITWNNYQVYLETQNFSGDQNINLYLYLKGETAKESLDSASTYVKLSYSNCTLREVKFKKDGTELFTFGVSVNANFCNTDSPKSKIMSAKIKGNQLTVFGSDGGTTVFSANIPAGFDNGKIGISTSGTGLYSLLVSGSDLK